jgi:hypothetical protein
MTMLRWLECRCHGLVTLVACAVILLVLNRPSAALEGETLVSGTGLPAQEVLRLGEQMYRKGLLPSGEPLQAIVKGDIAVDGTAFSCESCHLRSGLGSYEGGIITLPTNGSNLFKPLYDGPELTPAERAANARYIKATPRRPAYTDTSLAVALRGGINPAGQMLNHVMPRYRLQDRDMAILVFYLKSLSSELSPGVTETTLRFATIITEDVSPEDRNAMLEPLENYIIARNNQAEIHATRARYGGSLAESMDLSYRRLSLARWELKGPKETWRRQLEEYNRSEPVFALIGGITTGDWKPIHEFSEAHHIPCLFPITDFPVISESDWYTLYLSKGLFQEGEAAARSLARLEQLSQKVVVQIFQNSLAGRTLSAGFQETWHELDQRSPLNVMLKAGETLTADFLQQLIAKEHPAVVLLWTGPEALPALEVVAATANRPEAVFISAGQLKENLWDMPENVRDVTYITYPYRLAQDEKKYKAFIEPLLKNKKIQNPERRITARTYSLVRVLTQALMHMRRNFYRDNFLDVISMLPDLVYPVYERLSFGPGQRYASKGCYIVQLSKGPKPELIKKSDWVTH